MGFTFSCGRVVRKLCHTKLRVNADELARIT